MQVNCIIPKGKQKDWVHLLYWGIENLGEAEDGRCCNARLPEGWSVKEGNIDNDYSTYILDQNGYRRVIINDLRSNGLAGMSIEESRYRVRTDGIIAVSVWDMAERKSVKEDFPRVQYAKNSGRNMFCIPYEQLGVVYEGVFYYSARDGAFQKSTPVSETTSLQTFTPRQWSDARSGSSNSDAYGEVNLAIDSVLKPPAIAFADKLERESGWGMPPEAAASLLSRDGGR